MAKSSKNLLLGLGIAGAAYFLLKPATSSGKAAIGSNTNTAPAPSPWEVGLYGLAKGDAVDPDFGTADLPFARGVADDYNACLDYDPVKWRVVKFV